MEKVEYDFQIKLVCAIVLEEGITKAIKAKANGIGIAVCVGVIILLGAEYDI